MFQYDYQINCNESAEIPALGNYQQLQGRSSVTLKKTALHQKWMIKPNKSTVQSNGINLAMDLIIALIRLGSLPAAELFRVRHMERACAADTPETYTYYTISDSLQNSLPNPTYGCYA